MNYRLIVFRLLGTYLRHAPKHPGRWRLIGRAVALAPAMKTVSQPFVIRVQEGFRLQIDGSSQTGRMLYATGEYEPATTGIMKKLLRPGQTMLDVGANIGYFSVLGARLVGPGGHVVAFEPVPEVRRRLLANLQLNKIENVSVRGEALGDRSRGATLYYPPDDTGRASMRSLQRSKRVRIQQTCLDDLWSSTERITLIKIDIEGAELAALHGMCKCLSRDSPDLILEVTDSYLRDLGSSAQALLAFLADRGYSMYQIRNDGTLLRVDSRQLATGPWQFNALASKGTDINRLGANN